MSRLDDIQSTYDTSLSELSEWCDSEYQKYFSQYFQDQRELFSRLKSKVRPISDEELELILVQTPMQLFSVSEVVNRYKSNIEVIKLEMKSKEAEFIKVSTEKTDTKKKEAAQLALKDDKIFLIALGNVVSRVDSEISFSRELIMSAKKIWDSRRRGESVNPIAPVNPESIPPYKLNQTIC